MKPSIVSDAILAAVSTDRDNPSRLRDIAKAIGKTIEQTGAMLYFLMGRGRVDRVSKGLYVRVDPQ